MLLMENQFVLAEMDSGERAGMIGSVVGVLFGLGPGLVAVLFRKAMKDEKAKRSEEAAMFSAPCPSCGATRATPRTFT